MASLVEAKKYYTVEDNGPVYWITYNDQKKAFKFDVNLPPGRDLRFVWDLNGDTVSVDQTYFQYSGGGKLLD